MNKDFIKKAQIGVNLQRWPSFKRESNQLVSKEWPLVTWIFCVVKAFRQSHWLHDASYMNSKTKTVCEWACI